MRADSRVLVVGAGPVGLACAIACRRRGLQVELVDRGMVAYAIYRFPRGMRFFSTPELIEIGDHPLICSGPKPTREEALAYYRRVREVEGLTLHRWQRVLAVKRRPGPNPGLELLQENGASRRAGAVILATGYYLQPRLLGVPGEQEPFVSHYYDEGHLCESARVMVIGGRNSACEAALELWRHGARVVLVHRGATLGQSVKYWLRPDLENRIRQGAIEVHFETRVLSFDPPLVRLAGPAGEQTLEVDRVYALTGYLPDIALLRNSGVNLDPEGRPECDPRSLETNVPGLFLAGSLAAGPDAEKIFIENGREHAELIAAALATRAAG